MNTTKSTSKLKKRAVLAVLLAVVMTAAVFCFVPLSAGKTAKADATEGAFRISDKGGTIYLMYFNTNMWDYDDYSIEFDYTHINGQGGVAVGVPQNNHSFNSGDAKGSWLSTTGYTWNLKNPVDANFQYEGGIVPAGSDAGGAWLACYGGNASDSANYPVITNRTRIKLVFKRSTTSMEYWAATYTGPETVPVKRATITNVNQGTTTSTNTNYNGKNYIGFFGQGGWAAIIQNVKITAGASVLLEDDFYSSTLSAKWTAPYSDAAGSFTWGGSGKTVNITEDITGGASKLVSFDTAAGAGYLELRPASSGLSPIATTTYNVNSTYARPTETASTKMVVTGNTGSTSSVFRMVLGDPSSVDLGLFEYIEFLIFNDSAFAVTISYVGGDIDNADCAPYSWTKVVWNAANMAAAGLSFTSTNTAYIRLFPTAKATGGQPWQFDIPATLYMSAWYGAASTPGITDDITDGAVKLVSFDTAAGADYLPLRTASGGLSPIATTSYNTNPDYTRPEEAGSTKMFVTGNTGSTSSVFRMDVPDPSNTDLGLYSVIEFLIYNDSSFDVTFAYYGGGTVPSGANYAGPYTACAPGQWTKVVWNASTMTEKNFTFGPSASSAFIQIFPSAKAGGATPWQLDAPATLYMSAWYGVEALSIPQISAAADKDIIVAAGGRIAAAGANDSAQTINSEEFIVRTMSAGVNQMAGANTVLPNFLNDPSRLNPNTDLPYGNGQSTTAFRYSDGENDNVNFVYHSKTVILGIKEGAENTAFIQMLLLDGSNSRPNDNMGVTLFYNGNIGFDVRNGTASGADPIKQYLYTPSQHQLFEAGENALNKVIDIIMIRKNGKFSVIVKYGNKSFELARNESPELAGAFFTPYRLYFRAENTGSTSGATSGVTSAGYRIEGWYTFDMLYKSDFDMSGVTFTGKTVGYNGSEQSIKISGTLPAGVNVTYQNNAGTNAGVYNAVAKFTYTDSGEHEPIPDMYATLTIEKAVFNMSKITFNGKTVTYNGAEQKIALSGTLPAGVSVTYESNAGTNAGVYNAVAKFTYDTVNYEAIPDMNAVLTIEKAVIDMSGVSFASKTVTYDGTEYKLEIFGTLPAGVSVTYESNAGTNAGVYNAVAKFTYDTVNYEAIPDMNAVLTIKEAEGGKTEKTNCKNSGAGVFGLVFTALTLIFVFKKKFV